LPLNLEGGNIADDNCLVGVVVTFRGATTRYQFQISVTIAIEHCKGMNYRNHFIYFMDNPSCDTVKDKYSGIFGGTIRGVIARSGTYKDFHVSVAIDVMGKNGKNFTSLDQLKRVNPILNIILTVEFHYGEQFAVFRHQDFVFAVIIEIVDEDAVAILRYVSAASNKGVPTGRIGHNYAFRHFD